MEIKRERQAEKCEVRSRAGELFMNPLEHFNEFPQLFMKLAEKNDIKLCIVRLVKIEPLRVILAFS